MLQYCGLISGIGSDSEAVQVTDSSRCRPTPLSTVTVTHTLPCSQISVSIQTTQGCALLDCKIYRNKMTVTDWADTVSCIPVTRWRRANGNGFIEISTYTTRCVVRQFDSYRIEEIRDWLPRRRRTTVTDVSHTTSPAHYTDVIFCSGGMCRTAQIILHYVWVN